MSTSPIMAARSCRREPYYPLKRYDRLRHYYEEYSSSSSSSSDFDGSSYSSYASETTVPPSVRSPKPTQTRPVVRQEEMPARLGYKFYHLDPSASVETYNSVFSDDSMREDDEQDAENGLPIPTDDAIPEYLPEYQASAVDPTVRPSNPEIFGNLWPSRDGLLIRHDDLTPDGNMNLRVDTVVPTHNGRVTLQLFHFTIDNMSKRHCSLLRYCRNSGREVCNFKRAYAEPSRTSRPGIQRSVSSALRSVKHPFRRASPGADSKKRPLSCCSDSSWDTDSLRSMRLRSDSWTSDKPPPPASTLVPTDTIKVEFSNYARLDVSRNGGRRSKHYDFEWWGHKYSWKRVQDKNLNVVSYHLMRDGSSTPVAHITPDMRSPNQIEEDEWAGGWVPPCHMWISDQSIIDAKTDVADVVVATGLMTLVDDSIKARWHVKKQPKKSSRAASNDVHLSQATSLMQKLFQRRHSALHSSSPLRQQVERMISAY